MRALPLAFLLAGCAAQPLAPLPDAGRVWTEDCHAIPVAAYEAAPSAASAAGAAPSLIPSWA